MFGFAPRSKGCVVKSRSKLAPLLYIKDFTSNCIKGLVTGRNPTGGFRSLNPRTLISTVTETNSGLYKSYIRLYFLTSFGSCSVKDSRIPPAGISDLPVVRLYHFGAGRMQGFNSISSNYIKFTSTITPPTKSSAEVVS
jgi:hypothetical protein